MLEMIAGFYANRTFAIADCNVTSQVRPQHAGIAQGFPLSPYLFVNVMTVALIEARSWANLSEAKGFVITPDLVYADDTMLIASSAAEAQRYLDQVAEVRRANPCFHWLPLARRRRRKRPLAVGQQRKGHIAG